MKLGIDFGTCFSFMATMIGTDVRTTLVDDADRYSGLPTLFMHIENPDAEYYGRMAYDRIKRYPENCIKEIKKDIRIYPERISQASNYTYLLGGEVYKAEDIVKKFINYLVETAKTNAKKQGIADCNEIDEITITAPVGLNSDAKAMEACALYNEMLKRVAKQVTGITDDSRVHVLGEPIAAAIYNMHKHGIKEKQTILVYDLGGGTFDSAIVEYDPTNSKYEPIATGGYTDVGGGDWDNCIKAIIKRKTNFTGVEKAGRGYIPEDPHECAMFEAGVIEAKILLSSQPKALVNFTVGSNDYTEIITREEFEKESRSYLEKTISIVKDVIRQYEQQRKLSAGKGIQKIDRIVLVGGASQMPQVRARLKEEFPKFPDESIYLDDPQLAIAAGAAINNSAPVIPKVLHTYGISSSKEVSKEEYERNIGDPLYFVNDEDGKKEYFKKMISNIIFKGTTISGGYAEASKQYWPIESTQQRLRFAAYVSESSEHWIELENRPLFEYIVPIKPKTGQTAKQCVFTAKFRITTDGIVELYTYNQDNEEVGFERFPK